MGFQQLSEESGRVGEGLQSMFPQIVVHLKNQIFPFLTSNIFFIFFTFTLIYMKSKDTKNAAAQLLTHLKTPDHITLILCLLLLGTKTTGSKISATAI